MSLLEKVRSIASSGESDVVNSGGSTSLDDFLARRAGANEEEPHIAGKIASEPF